jgi:hypothetical protein
MDFSSLPRDFFITAFKFTKSVCTDVYASIDPSNLALSQAGKVIIITGAGTGIGQRVSETFFVYVLRTRKAYQPSTVLLLYLRRLGRS